MSVNMVVRGLESLVFIILVVSKVLSQYTFKEEMTR